MKKIKTTKQKIKKNKNKLIIISIIILIITTIHVNAGTQDSNLTRKVIDGYYAIAELSSGKHLYYLELYQMNGKPVYCIEIGNKITTNTYNSTTNLSMSGLSNSKIEYIQKIMYYGYDYPGHNDTKYYMAAQEMIWEYLEGINVYWTTEEDLNGQEYNIDSYKQTINNLIQNHDIKPSFKNISCTQTAGKSIILTDNNNVLKKYEVTNSGPYKTSIDENTLTIETDKTLLSKETVTLTQKSQYNNNSILYYNDSSQKLMSVGTIKMNTINVYVTTTGINLEFKLIDEETQKEESQGQATLTGAVYEVYDEDNNIIDTFETVEGERHQLENLLPKKYFVRQKKSSKGYKLNKNIKETNENKSSQIVTLTEEIIKGKIEILKIYGNDDKSNFQSESNIRFNIYDNKLNLYDSIITDNLGYATSTLIYGDYTIKQDNSTVGYKKVNDINLSIDENSEEVIRYNLFDGPIKVKINVITKNKETLNKINQEKIEYKLKNKDTSKYITYNNKDIFQTNELGEVLIPTEIPYGTYLLEQVTPPNKFLINEEVLTINVDENSELINDDNNDLILNVDYYNQPIKGIVHIITNEKVFKTKYNDYYYEIIPRKNIELELYANEDIKDSDNSNIYKKNDIVETLTTNEEGLIDSKILYLGKYCVREKNSNDKNYCFELKEINNKISLVEETVTITKEIPNYSVKLKNLDEETKEPIEGTIIELYTNDDELINSSVSNDDGTINIPSLPPGKYYFKEKSIKDDYILNEEKLYFEITNKNLELIITNKKPKKKSFVNLIIPNTFNNKKYLKEIISIFLIILGIIIYNVKKKNRRSNNN